MGSDSPPGSSYRCRVFMASAAAGGADAAAGPALTCGYCRRPATKLCDRCRLVGYCSRECQKPDWRVHRMNCGAPDAFRIGVDDPGRRCWNVQGCTEDTQIVELRLALARHLGVRGRKLVLLDEDEELPMSKYLGLCACVRQASARAMSANGHGRCTPRLQLVFLGQTRARFGQEPSADLRGEQSESSSCPGLTDSSSEDDGRSGPKVSATR